MTVPKDYEERVYAGVLGKMVGVYLGRPFESWTYERLMAELGEIDSYVNDRVPDQPPLVVTDDDLTGTFAFLRALADYDNTLKLSPQQIGQTWLNYIIENRTILWWSGLGVSTEHTAYLRLKNGVSAPASGSIALNGKIIAEQIGSQIFIDGWAMVAPGDPELAADLAHRAASVSHDGEAIYGAQVLAAMEALAFVESDINKLLDCGISMIPEDSTIYRLIADVREWYAAAPHDWHLGRAKVAQRYNYEIYGGHCHMVPNHALIILGLLYGQGDFRESMKVVNTAGWDTDCNAGNLGCLLGIRNGLATFEGEVDWRGPVADRIFLPTAEGGRALSDAAQVALEVINMGRALKGMSPSRPKHGARYHFTFPGSVQGWLAHQAADLADMTVANSDGRLALHFQPKAAGQIGRAGVYTFIPPDALEMPGYELLASPTLYPGQTVRAQLSADVPLNASLFLQFYNAEDAAEILVGERARVSDTCNIEWQIPPMNGQPIFQIGLQCTGDGPGTLYLDWLDWGGAPSLTLASPSSAMLTDQRRPSRHPLWKRAWVDGVNQWWARWPEAYRITQNDGRGLISQGSRDWQDYEARATIKVPLASAAGIGVRVQGLRRYYALLLTAGGKVTLGKALDGDTVLAEAPFHWEVETDYELRLAVNGNRLTGYVNDALLVQADDDDRPLQAGAVAYIIEEGTLISEAMEIRPA